MDKSKVAEILIEIGLLLELKGENPFKTRAYSNAARAIENLAESLDKVVAADEMDLAIDRICEDVLSAGRAALIANRRALRIGLEPLDTFRQYCSVYAREQAYCCISTELISNLEQNWNVRSRGTGREVASGGQRPRLNQEEEGNE